MRSFVRFSALQIKGIVTDIQRMPEKLCIFTFHTVIASFLLLSLLLLL